MSRLSLLLATSALMFALGSMRADDSQTDQEKLQGTWVVMEFVLNGQPHSEEERKDIKIVISGETLTLSGPAKGIGKKEFKFKIDPTKKPKAIDVTPEDGKFKGQTAPGIYELQEDTLKMCIPNKETTERPKDFKAPEKLDLALFVGKRSKP